MSRTIVVCAVLLLAFACTSKGGGSETTAVCGDGICAPSEIDTCPTDCASPGSGSGSSGPVCGNGVCETGENSTNCPGDCTVAMCGNGVCEPGENSTNCPQDCGGGTTTTFACSSSTTQEECYECFDDDYDYGLGACDEFGDVDDGDADECAACAGSGTFGICVTECGSGETSTCANCMANGGTVAPFDCVANQSSCGFCFEDDYEYGLGECDAFDDAAPGSAADCAMCVATGAYGSACETECGSGETLACAQCASAEVNCGDGTCEYYDGENYANCPADCAMTTCGDGICDVLDGETSATCGSDCLLADSFDCSNEDNITNCEDDCFLDDDTNEGGMLGLCDSNMDVTGGSAADCAACAEADAFGSGCGSACSGSGETESCAQCVDTIDF